MKYPRRNWKENRGYGKSASVACEAARKTDQLNETLFKLTHCYDLQDRATDQSVYQMDEAKGELAGILRDLDRLNAAAQRLLEGQGRANVEKAEAEWQAQSKQHASAA